MYFVIYLFFIVVYIESIIYIYIGGFQIHFF
jgi:hypothetical protein